VLAGAAAAMDVALAGVVVVITPVSLFNPYSVEEIRVFLEHGALVPVFVGVKLDDFVAEEVVERHRPMRYTPRMPTTTLTPYGGRLCRGTPSSSPWWRVHCEPRRPPGPRPRRAPRSSMRLGRPAIALAVRKSLQCYAFTWDFCVCCQTTTEN